MPYPEHLITFMRAELRDIGVRELKDAASVDAAVAASGTTLIVVNSVCGCAAGRARPGVALARQHARRPDATGTVFAGADIEATTRAREHMAPYPPSSPSVALFKDGRLVFMLERRDIERREAPEIAAQLTAAFDEHCAPAPAQA
jgi:putative YphP/YqiW family bacilliredoxin